MRPTIPATQRGSVALPIATHTLFLVIKPYNSILERRRSGEDDDDEPAPEPEEITLLRQIASNTAAD